MHSFEPGIEASTRDRFCGLCRIAKRTHGTIRHQRAEQRTSKSRDESCEQQAQPDTVECARRIVEENELEVAAIGDREWNTHD